MTIDTGHENTDAALRVIAEERNSIRSDIEEHHCKGTWLSLLVDRLGLVAEASLEDDPDKLHARLADVAAMATAWMEDLATFSVIMNDGRKPPHSAGFRHKPVKGSVRVSEGTDGAAMSEIVKRTVTRAATPPTQEGKP